MLSSNRIHDCKQADTTVDNQVPLSIKRYDYKRTLQELYDMMNKVLRRWRLMRRWRFAINWIVRQSLFTLCVLTSLQYFGRFLCLYNTSVTDKSTAVTQYKYIISRLPYMTCCGTCRVPKHVYMIWYIKITKTCLHDLSHNRTKSCSLG